MAAPEQHDRRDSDTRGEGPRNVERRASGDGSGTDEPSTGSRARDFMKRFRQPLIGLGLAGMALPMVQATTAQPTEEPPDTDAADPETAAAATRDAEDALVDRIADTRQDAERTQYVDDAVSQYGIDRSLAEDIYDIALEEGLEPKLAYGLVKTESTFDERAVSHVGARGLTQVMPRTAAWLIPGTKTSDLYDRQTNLRLGFTYLNQMIDKYKGDVRLALLAYNRGPGTVDKVLKQGGDPDNGYADKVLRG